MRGPFAYTGHGMPSSAPIHRPERQLVTTRKHDLQQDRQSYRALATNSAEWRAIRAGVLSHEPLCRCCRSKDVVTAATDVDHINNDPMDNRPENLQPLCKSCHSRKTAQEQRSGRPHQPEQPEREGAGQSLEAHRPRHAPYANFRTVS